MSTDAPHTTRPPAPWIPLTSSFLVPSTGTPWEGPGKAIGNLTSSRPSLCPVTSRHLRAWQQQALDAYTSTHPQDWLVTATPGAGKTTFALAVARHLWTTGRIRRLIVITPTDHLRRQWVEAGQVSGFDLRSTPNGEKLPRDADGVVATYAQVAAAPQVHEARTLTRPTMVIFDEIHHAGDDRSWGTGVVDAFDEARHRLAITGTPFRSDDTRIPHIRYAPNENGDLQSVSDFTYGYSQALRDGVVRPVVFAAYSGTSTWRNSAGEVLQGTLGDVSLSRTDEDAAWRTALSPDGEWIPHVFSAMSDRIEDHRNGHIPDAAGMVLASNQTVARQYAEVWEAVTGYKPMLILSDDPEASDNIARLRDDPTIKAAISVRMVSEGVDVPRISAMCVATTTSTPLFFAQAVGRVVRSRRRGETATVFLPAVRHLLGLAAELEIERDHVIETPPPGDDLDMPGDADIEPPPPLDEDSPHWEPIESRAEFSQVITSQREQQPAALDEDEAADLFGLPGLLTPDQEAALLAKRDQERAAAAKEAAAKRRARAAERDQPEQTSPAPVSGAEDADTLRRLISSSVAAYASTRHMDHREVWAMLYAKAPGPKNAEASVKLLRQRLAVINRL